MGYDWYTTEFDRQPSNKQKEMPRIGHVSILCMLIVLLLAIFFPLWQQGIHRSLLLEKQQMITQQLALEEQQQVLRAALSRSTMPEALLYGAIREDILFQPIEAEAVVLVARGQ